MAFDPSQYDRLTAASRAHARLEEFEQTARKHALLPRGMRRSAGWWLGWAFIAAVMIGLAYWLVSLG